jgi:hypothetical protein
MDINTTAPTTIHNREIATSRARPTTPPQTLPAEARAAR